MAVYGSVGNHDSVILRCVGRPGIIETDVVAKVFIEYRAVERADSLDIQSCSYFKKVLNLHAVFSYDADVISSCLIIPWLLNVKSTEFSESVCGKKYLFCAVICDHNLRPVYHRCKHEGQVMLAEGKASTVIYYNFPAFQIQVKEILHHAECFFVGNNCGVRVSFHEVCDVGCVVRFHVLYNKIIRFAITKNLLDVIKPFVGKIGIYCIHDSSFFVQDHIGVVGHTVWNFVLAFEKVNLVIVYAYIFDSICDFHEQYLFSFYGGFT